MCLMLIICCGWCWMGPPQNPPRSYRCTRLETRICGTQVTYPNWKFDESLLPNTRYSQTKWLILCSILAPFMLGDPMVGILHAWRLRKMNAKPKIVPKNFQNHDYKTWKKMGSQKRLNPIRYGHSWRIPGDAGDRGHGRSGSATRTTPQFRWRWPCISPIEILSPPLCAADSP